MGTINKNLIPSIGVVSPSLLSKDKEREKEKEKDREKERKTDRYKIVK